MGSLRIILAIAVVSAHSAGQIFVGGKLAVMVFYMISGFLISQIIGQKKQKPLRVLNFYISRFLRLWPSYFFVLISTLIANSLLSSITSRTEIAAGGGVLSSRLNIVINSFFSFDLMNRITLLFSNFTMIFSDLFNFLNYGSGKLNLGTSPNFSGSSLLVIPQAWTLGLEISFYILAPFLLSSKSKIVISTITFFLITLFSQIYGIGLREPWDYRFLPFSAIYFMLGAVSQKFIADTRRVKIQRWKCNILVVLCLATSLGYFLIPNSFKIYAQQVYLLQIFLSLPFLFEFSKCYNLDRKIGELSYPVYLLHILVIDILFDFETYFYGGTNSFLTFLLCVPICIMFSIFVNRFIARPVDEFRKKHFKLI